MAFWLPFVAEKDLPTSIDGNVYPEHSGEIGRAHSSHPSSSLFSSTIAFCSTKMAMGHGQSGTPGDLIATVSVIGPLTDAENTTRDSRCFPQMDGLCFPDGAMTVVGYRWTAPCHTHFSQQHRMDKGTRVTHLDACPPNSNGTNGAGWAGRGCKVRKSGFSALRYPTPGGEVSIYHVCRVSRYL